MHYQISHANRLGNRKVNQDRFKAIESQDGVLLLLADGMGGRKHGEWAAERFMEVAEHHYSKVAQPVKNIPLLFRTISIEAHMQIMDEGKRQNWQTVPGTTGVFALIQNNRVYWAHIGDSRFYLFRDGKPLIQTVDHSYVEYLYKRGLIERHQMENHPNRHQVTRCIGCYDRPITLQIGGEEELQDGDRVLLCSDGLWAPLGDERLRNMFSVDAEIGEVAEAMATEAEQSAYPKSDNISLLALEFGEIVHQSHQDRSPSVVSEENSVLNSALGKLRRVFRHRGSSE